MKQRFFIMLLMPFGQQVSAGEPASEMRTPILDIIYNWNAKDGEVHLKKFYLPNGERGLVFMCGAKIYDGPRILGTVFMGEDITTYCQMLKLLLLVMVIVALFFLVIAVFIGHSLAKRAIIPIQQSFLRQKRVYSRCFSTRTPLNCIFTFIRAIESDDNHLSPFSSQVLDDMKSETRKDVKNRS